VTGWAYRAKISAPMTRPVNGYPGVRVPVRQLVPGQQNERTGTVNVPDRIAVVINNSRLALISAATKACTFRVVALLKSATETGHSSGRQGVGGREWVRRREPGVE